MGTERDEMILHEIKRADQPPFLWLVAVGVVLVIGFLAARRRFR